MISERPSTNREDPNWVPLTRGRKLRVFVRSGIAGRAAARRDKRKSHLKVVGGRNYFMRVKRKCCEVRPLKIDMNIFIHIYRMSLTTINKLVNIENIDSNYCLPLRPSSLLLTRPLRAKRGKTDINNVCQSLSSASDAF